MLSSKDMNYLDMPLEQVELSVGELLVQGELGAKPFSDDDKRAAAKRWFNTNLPQFMKAICDDKSVMGTILGPSRKDRNMIFVTLFDTLTVMGGFPIPIGAVTAMIIHYGVDRLCSGHQLSGND